MHRACVHLAEWETRGNKGIGGRRNWMCFLKPFYLITNINSRERMTFIMKNIIFKSRIKWVSEIERAKALKATEIF